MLLCRDFWHAACMIYGAEYTSVYIFIEFDQPNKRFILGVHCIRLLYSNLCVEYSKWESSSQ